MTRYVYDETDTYKSKQSLYYMFDDLGSVTAITDDTGTPVQMYMYDAYGNVTNTQNDPINNFAFVGRYGGFRDWDTGLTQFLHRWYDSKDGRWLSRDPIGTAGGYNFYEYGFGNPVNKIDIYGLFVAPSIDPWTKNFVINYLTVGKDVNLNDVGLLNRYINSSSVRSVVSAHQNGLMPDIRKTASEACAANNNSKSLSVPYNVGEKRIGVTNVVLEPGLFSVGSSTLFGTTDCMLSINCEKRKLSYSCNLMYGIKDEFKDPLDFDRIGLPPFDFGKVYKITAGWTESCSGSGPF